ncbi:MBL fold metallo-hydrolase [Sphaerisporangium sp. NPDC051011]|uniref:MBL fold metallo-hydrolase n=1 Tax=Sphaerisporangium sp. NPDC051011 TaxID=3155792 RepID=UPI0033C88AE7
MPSNLRATYQAAPDVFTFPSSLPIPGAGRLPVNAFLIRSAQPILVDTGMAIDRGHFENALWSLVEPEDLRWIILTHDDRDHAGNLKEVLMAAPHAKLITNGLSVARLGEEWDVPAHRVVQVNPGRTLDLGGREISLLRPPSFDSPSTLAVYDHRSEALFSADSLGTVIPELAENAAEVSRTDYLDGVSMFTRANAPWTALVDQNKWNALLDSVALLRPRLVLSAHGLTVEDRIEELLGTVRAVPTQQPWLPGEDVEAATLLAAHDTLAEVTAF